MSDLKKQTTIKDKVSRLIQLNRWIGPNGYLNIIYYKKKFFIWNGKIWIKHSKEEVYNIIVRTAHEHDDFLDDTKDSLIRDILRNLAAISYVEKLHKGKRRSKPNEIGVSYSAHINGILRIQVSKNCVGVNLIPFDSDVSVTSVRNYIYKEDAGCPNFLKYLNELLPPEDIPFVQEFMGLSLIPSNPTQKFAIFYGSGNNGKSSLLLAFLKVIGAENISNVPLKEFLPNAKFGLILTEDKLLNCAEELDEYGNYASSALKNYVTQGKIIVQEKHQNLYPIKATAKLIFSTNFFPRFKDFTDGFNRRIEILPFTRKFINHNIDYSEEEYWDNCGELSGILNWALKGLKRLATNNWCFTESPNRKKALEDYKQTSNPAIQFLNDYLESDATKEVLNKEIFKRYLDHCKAYNLFPEEEIPFGRNIKKVFPNAELSEGTRLTKDKDKVRSRYWTGIRFKTNDDPEPTHIAHIVPETNSSALTGDQNE